MDSRHDRSVFSSDRNLLPEEHAVIAILCAFKRVGGAGGDVADLHLPCSDSWVFCVALVRGGSPPIHSMGSCINIYYCGGVCVSSDGNSHLVL